MLSEAQLRAHLIDIGLPEAGIDYVLRAAKSGPAKKVNTGTSKSISGEVACITSASVDEEDVNHRIQFSALSTEFAFAILADADHSNLLILDQPTSIRISITNVSGRRQRIVYTADYLLVTDKCVRVVELKTKREAEELCRSRPNTWRKEGDKFHYVQAEAAYSDLGISFEVLTEDELPWMKVQNLLHLRTIDRNNQRLDSSLIAEMRAFVERRGPSSISEIVAKLRLEDGLPVLASIVEQHLFVDMDNARLQDPHSRIICINEIEAKNVGRGLASLQQIAKTSARVDVNELSAPSHVAVLGYRVAVLEGQRVEFPGKKPPSKRTIRRWKKARREGGIASLRPGWPRCGKKGPRVPPWHYKLLIDQIKNDKGSTTYISRIESHQNGYQKALEKTAAELGVEEGPIGYSHYCELWKQRRHSVEDAFEKGGSRLANAVAPHGDVDTQLPLATRPLQVAHIDHCLAPVESESVSDGKEGKPWLTILVDDFGPEPIASILRYESPSFETDGLVLRDCLARHGRLPEFIYSDGGSDFTSLMFAGCLAELGIGWFKRPTANPRFGAEVERPFMTFASTVCAGRIGFVPDIVNARAISRNKHPARLDRRSIEDLSYHTEHLLHAVIPNLPGENGEPSVKQRREDFEQIYGKQGVSIERDLRFLVATAPPINLKGKSEPSGAIRIGNKRFYSTALHGRSVSLRRLSPRLEPEDASIIYVFLGKAWVVAKSRDALDNVGRDDRQVKADALGQNAGRGMGRQARREALHTKPESGAAEVEDAAEPANGDTEVREEIEKVDWSSIAPAKSTNAAIKGSWRRE